MWALPNALSDALAADMSTSWQFAGTIILGVLSLTSALGGGLIALRGTKRQTDTTRDTARETSFDARVDADRQALYARVDALRIAVETVTADRDRYREMYARLRVDVIAAGLNPDSLSKGGAGDPASR